jgi:hypothetical protein
MAEQISQTEAHSLIVKWIRAPDQNARSYGYDLYLPPVISKHLGNPPFGELELFMRVNMPAFTAAAWELCRRGMLRPGVRDYGGQGTSEGYGYSITQLGEEWLAESKSDPYIAIEPNQIGAMLAQHRDRFGDGFRERSQEAVRCYQANAHLACCAMCGAAAESVLLGLAFARHSETQVLKEYLAKGGRGRVQAKIFGSVPRFLQDQASAGLSLLKYWRDDAAHGGFSGLSEAHSFTSLLLLLRLVALADDHWDILTMS